MKVSDFLEIINVDFYVGVPDSQLKELCNYLYKKYGIDKKHHIIAANEGNCVGIAAGYNLATGKVPLVYMQNSGEGNAINPIASLLNEQVYGIPMIFIIGWRGEPGGHDEPQHCFQGQITTPLLDLLEISFFVIDKETTEDDVRKHMRVFELDLKQGKQVAFVVRKNSFNSKEECKYGNANNITREEAIEHIVKVAGDSPIISTTGKASRELFEIREHNNQTHERDFLTVGSMGHSSSIALGVATQVENKKVWCIDGDGAVIMHMGSLGVIGTIAPDNLIHVVINNQAHESVGGMPTVAKKISLSEVAKSCGYKEVYKVSHLEDLDNVLKLAMNSQQLCLIEIECSIGARNDLGRPTTSPKENKKAFMQYIASFNGGIDDEGRIV